MRNKVWKLTNSYGMCRKHRMGISPTPRSGRARNDLEARRRFLFSCRGVRRSTIGGGIVEALSEDRERRALGPVLARCLGAIAIAVSAAAALAPAPAAAKYATLVMDAETGRVLHSVNADTRNYPASLTKMMTLYMVFHALDEGRWSLDEHLPISAPRRPAAGVQAGPGEGAHRVGARRHLRPGDQVGQRRGDRHRRGDGPAATEISPA